MKKIFKSVFLFCVGLFTLALAACGGKADANELINSLLVDQESFVESDFYVVGEMKSIDKSYEITWESNNACLAISETKNELGYYTVTLTRPEDEVQTVTLTATLHISKYNSASKDFEFRVYPIDVYNLLDSFEFKHKGTKVEMGSTIDLPTTTEFEGKTATITWASTNQEVTISEDYSKATFATVVKDTAVKLAATLSYKNETTTVTYNLTIAPYQTDFEKLQEWYENAGITQVLSGYVVEIGSAYSESYNNISLYIVNDDFTGGYYLYRVKMDANEASQLQIGSHVTATGTVNTNYSGLMETNAGGNLVVDEDIPAINIADHVYAMDNDLIANVKSLYYRTSTLVSLSNWKVVEVAEDIDDGKSSAVTILKLSKDGVTHTVRYSNYIANTPLPNRNNNVESEVYKAVKAKLATIAVGDYVDVNGILSYHNKDSKQYDQGSYQIMITGDESITKIENGSDETNTVGKKMGAAIAAFGGFETAYVAAEVINLPATLGDAIVTWAFHNRVHDGATLENNVLSINPSGFSKVSLDATFTIGDYTTTVYYSFIIEDLTDEEIVERAVADVTLENTSASGTINLPTSHDLYEGVAYTYELVVGDTPYKSVTLVDNVLTINVATITENETVTLKVTATKGDIVKTNNIEFVVEYIPEPAKTNSTVADLIAITSENEMKAAYYVTGTVERWGSSLTSTDTAPKKYGNFVLQSGENKIIVWGSTATADKLVWNSGVYTFTNPQDFLTNELTKTINIGAEVKLLVVRTSFKGNPQLNAIVLEVTPAGGGEETDPVDPVEPTTVETIAGALAAADKTPAVLTGVVKKIDTAWNDSFKNISVILSDGTNDILVYRLATKVELGDKITVTGTVGSHNNAKQIAAGATAEILTVVNTIEGALAAEDDLEAILAGTVKSIDTAWSDQYKNITITLTDGTNDISVYRLATNVRVGDEIIVVGKVGSHNSNKQIAAGSWAIITKAAPVALPEGVEAATAKFTGTAIANMVDNANNAATVGLDATIFTVTGDKGGKDINVGLNASDGSIRLYGVAGGNGNTLTISVAPGYEITEVVVTFGSIVGSFTVNGTAGSKETTTYTINGSSVAIKNVTDGTDQVRFTSIEIHYKATASAE